MYVNFWYAAEESKNITNEKPVKVQMLGHYFALWRDTKGEIKCVSDTCTHRGGALGDGRIQGDCLECPYHGWTFNGNGSCVRIPSLGPDAKIPDWTRVDAYPVQEKYGLVWTFLGDLPEEERPPIIDIPEYDDPKWRSVLLRLTWKIDYKRSVENTMDPAHNEFTHPTHGFLGVHEDYHVEELNLTETEWGVGFMNRMFTPRLPDKGMHDASGRKGDAYIDAGVGNHCPNTTWVQIHVSDKAWMHNYLIHTPIHEKLGHQFVFATRNNMLDPKHDKIFAERTAYIAQQDQDVLEPLHPILTPRSQTHEFFTPADKCIARYREFCREWEERGWRIDVDKVRQDEDRIAYAIPSPARRKKAKGWVLPAVPLLPGKTPKRIVSHLRRKRTKVDHSMVISPH